MGSMKWVFAAVLTGALAATTPASAKDYKIGYSVFWGTNPFLVTMVNGAKKAAEEWKAKGVNIDLIVTNGGDDDKAKQVSDLEDLSAQKIDGVLIFPGDSVMVAEPIKTIFNAQNIPVVITDIGIRSGKYISLIITDNKKGGEQAGEYMASLLPKGSKVITLDHAPTNDNGQTRRKGFETKSAELGLQVLPEQPVARLTFDIRARLWKTSWSRSPTLRALLPSISWCFKAPIRPLSRRERQARSNLSDSILIPCPIRW